MTATIRPATRSDSDALGRLGAMLMRTHYDFDSQRFLQPAESAERGYGSFLTSVIDSEHTCVFVAETADAIVGYVYAGLEPMSWKELRGPAGFIHDILVTEDARGSGAAEALMNAATDWLREHGAPRVILWTAAPNATAQRLFRRLGFRETMIEMTREIGD